jgi:ATP dependent DNA ligase-like protein
MPSAHFRSTKKTVGLRGVADWGMSETASEAARWTIAPCCPAGKTAACPSRPSSFRPASRRSPIRCLPVRLDPRGEARRLSLQVRREHDTERLFARRGFDWTSCYPAIVRTARSLPAKSCTLDGEAVVCGGDGIAVFADLHRRGVVSEAMLYAFDLLEYGGEDLRPSPSPTGSGSLRRSSAGAVWESCCRSTPTRTYSGGLSDGAGGRRLEAALLAPPIGSLDGLAQSEEP